MSDNWYDDRDWRDRDWRRREREGRGRDGDYDQTEYGAAENRSFGRGDRDYRGQDTSRFAARRSGPDRDHVFGERETTEVYTGEPYQGRGRYSGGYGRPQDYARQNQDYVRDAQDYTRGGRFYGDDGRERIYREVYGQGGRYYGPVPSGYDAGERDRDRGRQRDRDHELNNDDYWRFGFAFDPLEGGYAYPYLREDRYERQNRGGYTPNVREGRGEGGRGWFEKARDEVSSWFGSRDAERRRDWDAKTDSHRGRGPQGYKRSDERISDEVHERLTDDPWVDASAIQVSVSAGEVTLSGTVGEREAKHRAERIVEDISGVNHVQNNLRIERGAFFTRATSGYGDSVQQAQMAGSPTATSSGTGLAASTSTDATGSTDQASRGKSAN